MRAKKCVGFDKFKDLLSNYVVKHMRDFAEIVSAIKHQSDPVAEYIARNADKFTEAKTESGTIEEMLLKE